MPTMKSGVGHASYRCACQHEFRHSALYTSTTIGGTLVVNVRQWILLLPFGIFMDDDVLMHLALVPNTAHNSKSGNQRSHAVARWTNASEIMASICSAATRSLLKYRHCCIVTAASLLLYRNWSIVIALSSLLHRHCRIVTAVSSLMNGH
jgi:hypothetical protein